MLSIFVANKWDTSADPNLPSPLQLQPFLDPSMLHLVGCNTSTMRGPVWEQTVLYAMYARYLLLTWRKRGGRAPGGEGWIPLSEIVSCPAASRYEVNLSAGVLEGCEMDYETAVTACAKCQQVWNNGLPNAHHDVARRRPRMYTSTVLMALYFLCRRRGFAAAAVPLRACTLLLAKQLPRFSLQSDL